MKSPLIIATIIFSAGIIISNFFLVEPVIFLVIAAGLLILSFVFINKKLFSIFFLSAVFFVSFGLAQNAKSVPVDDVSRFISTDKVKSAIKGVVISDPEQIFDKISDENSEENINVKKASFILKIDSLRIEKDFKKVSGFLYVYVWRNDFNIKYGDEVVLEGKISGIRGPEHQGDFDFKKYLANKKIRAIFNVGKKDAIIIVSNTASYYKKFIYNARHAIEKNIYRYFSKDYGDLLRAMILGVRYGFSDDIENIFIRTGTVHILAISGMNIGMILLLFLIILNILRFPRKIKFMLAVFLIVSFTIFCGGKPPVMRATIMAVVFLIGLIIDRGNSLENSFFIAAFLMLIYAPLQIFDPSFQLSFASLGGIIYGMPVFEKILKIKSIEKKSVIDPIKIYFLETISITLSAMLGVLPLVAYYFKIISPIALISNLVIVPVVFLITSAGLLFIIGSFLSGWLAIIFSEVTKIFIWILFASAEMLSKVPLGYFEIKKPNIFVIIASYVVLYIVFKQNNTVIFIKIPKKNKQKS